MNVLLANVPTMIFAAIAGGLAWYGISAWGWAWFLVLAFLALHEARP